VTVDKGKFEEQLETSCVILRDVRRIQVGAGLKSSRLYKVVNGGPTATC
jgi:hypothetical protein